MFRGNFEHTIDTKGRLSIPAKFREVLTGNGNNDASVVITNYVVEGETCLEVYPTDEWSRMEEKIYNMSRFNEPRDAFETYYLGACSECDIDTHGRILIPSSLREYAGLGRDVVLASAVEKFRVWDREKWKAARTKAEAKLKVSPGFFGELKI
jgi:MraZ protein